MVFGIIGENCSGKSTLANEIQKTMGAEIIAGKDYLRMAKSGSEAAALFRKKLESSIAGHHVVYLIAEPELIQFLPENAVRILVSADIDTIKERFKARMHGNLPAPVARMLERKHGVFDSGSYDYRFDGVTGDASAFCKMLKAYMG